MLNSYTGKRTRGKTAEIAVVITFGMKIYTFASAL